MPLRHWLLKSEPDAFSIDDLEEARGGTTQWDGVRNYQARNLLRDELKTGDLVLYYHSNADPPAVVGTAEVVREGYPDPSQFDRKSDGFDPAATRETPRWFCVDIKYRGRFPHAVTLERIKQTRALANMVLVKRSRLSVQPVTASEYALVVKLGETP
jgi:predicted RNA-binding protein with PUA-like domain